MSELKNLYDSMNDIATPNSIVFFGSTYFSELPVCELSKSFGLDETIYNRSVAGLSIDDVSYYIKTCVTDLNPGKIFIQIGEEDVKNENLNVNEFISKYEWLLYTIHNETKAKIYIVPIFGNHGKYVNARLYKLADESGCTFVEVQEDYGNKSKLLVFSKLKHYIRNGNMDFCDAINAVSIT